MGDIEKLTVHTIGHSTRKIGDFMVLLEENGIRQLVDIRTIPRSRHNPQYGSDELSASLESVGIKYIHMASLGGLRRPLKNSPNGGWRNDSFRGFADYMQTSEFGKGIDALILLAQDRDTAIMCAEAVPWRCHRSLVSDALFVRGVHVWHIMGTRVKNQHKLTPFARVDGIAVIYPPIEQPLF